MVFLPKPKQDDEYLTNTGEAPISPNFFGIEFGRYRHWKYYSLKLFNCVGFFRRFRRY